MNGYFQPPNTQFGAGRAPTFAQPTFGQQQRMYTDKIHNIFNRGFAANHLITVGLIFREVIKDLNQKPDLKDRYFFFVSLAPGIGDGANRTYSWEKHHKITMKFSIREIGALGFILKQCSIGNENNVLPYVKFSKSEGQSKSCSIWMGTKVQTINQQQVNSKQIFMAFSNGNEKHISALTAAEAYSMGEELDMAFKKGFELEVEYQKANPQAGKDNPDAPYNTSGYEQPAGMMNNAPMNNVPMMNGGFNSQMPPTGQPPFAQPVPSSTPTPNMVPQMNPQNLQQVPGQYPQFAQPSGFPSAHDQTVNTASQFGSMLLNTTPNS